VRARVSDRRCETSSALARARARSTDASARGRGGIRVENSIGRDVTRHNRATRARREFAALGRTGRDRDDARRRRARGRDARARARGGVAAKDDVDGRRFEVRAGARDDDARDRRRARARKGW
jgi:hypothetical protein